MCKLMKGDILMYQTQMKGDLYDLSHNENLNLDDYAWEQINDNGIGMLNPGLNNWSQRNHRFLNDIVTDFRKGYVVFEPNLKNCANIVRDIHQIGDICKHLLRY